VSDQVVTGIFTLLGVAMGLFGERWVRTWGAVRCDLVWWVARSTGSVDSPGGVEVQERQLKATFSNRKDIPVTIWDMRVVFYKGDKPLDEGTARPSTACATTKRAGPSTTARGRRARSTARPSLRLPDAE
jgi:hypothetical protein